MEAFNWEAFYTQQPVSGSSPQLVNASPVSIPGNSTSSILLTPPDVNDPQNSPLISQQLHSPENHNHDSVSTTFGLNGVLDSNLYSGGPFHPPDTAFVSTDSDVNDPQNSPLISQQLHSPENHNHDSWWPFHPPDTAFVSTDSVFFYVHSDIILSISYNNFRSLIPTPLSRSISRGQNAQDHFRPPGSRTINTIRVPEPSEILNLILHIIYNIYCTSRPTLTELSTAIGQLSLYGVHTGSQINVDSQTYALLIARAPFAPLDVYVLAAKRDLRNVAVATSPHLLSLRLPTITDEIAEEMGPKYLRKLFFLHVGRLDALKRILLHPPQSHTPISSCSFTNQQALTRAWALASAQLVWDARPDMSPGYLQSTFSPLANDLSCDFCKQYLQGRIRRLLDEWAAVKASLVFLKNMVYYSLMFSRSVQYNRKQRKLLAYILES
ncbi:hypothetical protein BDP27DRAFT_1449713 [Rhodocollybia butyracea]|uniref:Uncharacterized protein n=1 Tax=Rhodocollybia butyracea TaxID=206335 RepID=A0A9P5U506_9AGAR|nr:hypothetical protein BDP27DRAFT_1449713 [Rhodocollybia butyracea]